MERNPDPLAQPYGPPLIEYEDTGVLDKLLEEGNQLELCTAIYIYKEK